MTIALDEKAAMDVSQTKAIEEAHAILESLRREANDTLEIVTMLESLSTTSLPGFVSSLRAVMAAQERARADLASRLYAAHEDADERPKGRKPGLSAKTAANVWGEVTSGFGEAMHSKLDELRVIESNPATGVRPPMTTDEREQAALYPAEIEALLSCERVPIERRRVYALAIYTGMRRSELERLQVADVDQAHGLITVRGTKTTAAKRQIPIEPSLAPLLALLIASRESGPIVDAPRADGKGGAADLVKKDLRRAGLERPDLFRDDADHMPFTFHGLRHTAITHWAIAVRDASWLILVAGHTDKDMTLRYLDKAAVIRGSFGAPHAPLPPGLTSTEVPKEFWASSGFVGQEDKSKTGNPEGFPVVLTVALRPQRESNPRYRRERPMS